MVYPCDYSPCLKAGASIVFHEYTIVLVSLKDFSLECVEYFTGWTAHPNAHYAVVKEPHAPNVESFQLLPF
jgi:hypothetical protein